MATERAQRFVDALAKLEESGDLEALVSLFADDAQVSAGTVDTATEFESADRLPAASLARAVIWCGALVSAIESTVSA